MKKLIFAFVPFCSLIANNEAPLNEIQSLIDTKNKKIYILEKKDLKDVLIENKPLPVITSNNFESKNTIVSSEPIQEIVMNNSNTENTTRNKSLVVNKPIEKKVNDVSSIPTNLVNTPVAITVVDNITNYNEYINSIKSTNTKNITMSFSDLIKATKYVFDNNLENKYSSELKPKLLEEAKKIGNIDMLFFEEALNNMNKQTINELASNLGEI